MNRDQKTVSKVDTRVRVPGHVKAVLLGILAVAALMLAIGSAGCSSANLLVEDGRVVMIEKTMVTGTQFALIDTNGDGYFDARAPIGRKNVSQGDEVRIWSVRTMRDNRHTPQAEILCNLSLDGCKGAPPAGTG